MATKAAPAHGIVLFPGTLSPSECEEITRRFDGDPEAQPSITQVGRDDRRSGTQVRMGSRLEWADAKRLCVDRITRRFREYVALYPGLQYLLHEEIILSSPIMERIAPGQGFDWHIDSGTAGSYDRFLSALMYLRDVKEGGQTEFPGQQMRITPKAGTLVMFPPFWTHLHRGAPPVSGTKYNLTAYFQIRPR